MTGSGKSRLTKKLLQLCKRSFIIDVKGEYSGSIFYTVTDVIDYIKYLNENESFRIVCRQFSSEQLKYLFEVIYVVGNCTLCLEEAQNYLYDLDEYFYLDECIRRGREHRINIICVSQRVPDFHPDVRSQCNSFVTFKQMETVDLHHLNGRNFDVEKVPLLKMHDNHETAIEGVHFLCEGEKLSDVEQWFTKN